MPVRAEDAQAPQTARSRQEVLAALAPKYLWWPVESSAEERNARILAQVMDLGTYEDIRAVEAVFNRTELVEILARAQPGWFSPRSWEFWRGRLSVTSVDAVPARPPRRSFDAEVLRTRA
jgi:hypothetical protein